MHNMDFKVEGDKLIVMVDISKKAIDAAPPSSSGRTFLVGTTGGTHPIASNHCRSLIFAINVMAKK